MKKRRIEITSEAQLKSLFRTFNDEYFDGVLPMPDFEIMKSFRYFGYFMSDIEDDTTVNPVIKISDQYVYTESQLRDVFVHEMIHYYLAYMGIDVKGSHSKEFYKMVDKFNRKYKMHITETINMNEYVRREGTSWLKYTLAKLF